MTQNMIDNVLPIQHCWSLKVWSVGKALDYLLVNPSMSKSDCNRVLYTQVSNVHLYTHTDFSTVSTNTSKIVIRKSVNVQIIVTEFHVALYREHPYSIPVYVTYIHTSTPAVSPSLVRSAEPVSGQSYWHTTIQHLAWVIVVRAGGGHRRLPCLWWVASLTYLPWTLSPYQQQLNNLWPISQYVVCLAQYTTLPTSTAGTLSNWQYRHKHYMPYPCIHELEYIALQIRPQSYNLCCWLKNCRLHCFNCVPTPWEPLTDSTAWEDKDSWPQVVMI